MRALLYLTGSFKKKEILTTFLLATASAQTVGNDFALNSKHIKRCIMLAGNMPFLMKSYNFSTLTSILLHKTVFVHHMRHTLSIEWLSMPTFNSKHLVLGVCESNCSFEVGQKKNL